MRDLETLRNLGHSSAEWLHAVDVSSIEQLREIGSAEAYREVVAAGFKPGLNLLYAMEAGLRGLHWLELSEDDKQQLRQKLSEK